LALGLVLISAIQAPALSVIINEFMAANSSTLADEDGDYSDWIEIFNTAATPVNLGGWFLTDDSSALGKWQFPATNLAAGKFLIIFASDKNRSVAGQPLHTNFRLSADGEYLALVRPDGVTVESAFAPGFPKQRQDVSYGLVTGTGTNGFLLPATPGNTNGSTSVQFVEDLQFSHARGFYATNFDLTITCATPGATIYYTTNGSPPGTTNGAEYTGPVPVARTTVIRARAEKTGCFATAVETRTCLFLADVLSQSTNGAAPPGWPASWGTNVVNYGMDPAIVNQLPWSGTISNDLRAIPTVSVVMSLGDLFNASNGIYANAQNDGIAWERPASVELIYPDGKTGFQVNAGARIRGNWSRSPDNPKHSLRFICRDEYGDAKLKFKLFGPTGAAEPDKFDLRTAQDDSWAFQGDAEGLFVNDSFARDTSLAMGEPAERGDWYHLYLNGQYWGIYETCEHPEASYAANYFGGASADYDVLKPDRDYGYAVTAADGNNEAWQRLWQAAAAGFASNSNYFRVQGLNTDGSINSTCENLLDVTNLADYMLVTFWIGNLDGPLAAGTTPNNFCAIRSRKNTAGFRFLTHDAENTLYILEENRVATTTVGETGPDQSNPQYLWTRLLENAEFKQLFADRIQKHFFGDGALTRDACTARFQACAAELDRAIVGESARWGNAKRYPALTRNDWLVAINDKRTNYFPLRAGIVLNQLRRAGVFPSLGAPVFAQASGQVPVGFALALSHTNASGSIFYTLDGSDPRQIGGGLGAGALNYGGPISITTSVQVRARVKNGASWSPLAEAAFYPAQDFTGLRLTEVMYNPLPSGTISGDEFEFLELKNTGTNAIDLGGATFSAGITFTFTNGTLVTPSAFVVLGRSATNFAARYPGVSLSGIYTGKLDNSGEKIALATALGVEILSLTYDDNSPWTAVPDGYGFSLVSTSTNGAAAPNDSQLWRASSNSGGSPGADDPPLSIPPVLINEILAHTDPPQSDSIELFNPTTNSVDLGGWFITDDSGSPRKFRIPNGTSIAAGSFVYFTEADFNPGGGGFVFSSIGESACLYSGTAAGTNLTSYAHSLNFGASANGVSFGRYVNSVGEEQFPAQMANTFGSTNSGPRVGPVVISEIHYHPLTNDDEFVELLNITGAPVALFDSVYPTNTWRVNGLGFALPTGVTLPAGGLALIVATNPALFRAKYNVSTNVPVWGPFGGVLQDDGERLELQRPDTPNTDGSVPYLTVDEVRYRDRTPWPVAADGDGASLQRLVLTAYGNDPTNWFAGNITPGRLPAPPPPELQISLVPPDVILAFTAQAFRNYTVEHSTNLASGLWLTCLDLPASGTLTNYAIVLQMTNAAAEFFRVVAP
jgi:hypothetical protein